MKDLNLEVVKAELAKVATYPKFNLAEYPQKDGVRFSRSLRKELEECQSTVDMPLNIRSMFIAKFIDLGKTKAHASNYWQKTNDLLADKNPHASNMKWASKQKKSTTVVDEGQAEVVEDPVMIDQPENVEVPTNETVDIPQVVVSTDEIHRWRVVDVDDVEKIVASFTTRDKMFTDLKNRKDNGEKVKWVDGNK